MWSVIGRSASERYAWSLGLRSPETGQQVLGADRMSPAEQMFFLGAPLAHVVEYERQLRTRRVNTPPRTAARLTRIAIRRGAPCQPALTGG